VRSRASEWGRYGLLLYGECCRSSQRTTGRGVGERVRPSLVSPGGVDRARQKQRYRRQPHNVERAALPRPHALVLARPPAHFLTGSRASELSLSFSHYRWRADPLLLGGCTASADSNGATGHAHSLAPAPVSAAPASSLAGQAKARGRCGSLPRPLLLRLFLLLCCWLQLRFEVFGKLGLLIYDC